MIRKIIILTTVALLFVYTAWNFYTEALSYAPLSSMKFRKTKPKDAGIALSSKYKSEWTKEIHEKNLFSPYRSYIPPKPVVVAPPPKRPELALKGIVLDTFGDYVGYIEINQAKAMPMRKGDKMEDIEIVDITDRRVVVKWNIEMINLSMEKIKTIDKPGTKR